jgi:hypothetical protein
MDAAWVSAAAADVVAVRASQAAVDLVQRVRAALGALLAAAQIRDVRQV